jgi:hypothetical protein
MWMQEFGKHDKEPAKYIKQWKGNNSKTGAPFSCDVGYERFLAPEVGTSIPYCKVRFIYFHTLVMKERPVI